jgi:hypothetical protein
LLVGSGHRRWESQLPCRVTLNNPADPVFILVI